MVGHGLIPSLGRLTGRLPEDFVTSFRFVPVPTGRTMAAALLACGCLMLVPPTYAAEGTWRAGLGLAAFAGPQYPGSSSDRAYAYPLPYLAYHGRRFTFDRNRASLRLRHHWRLGVSADGTPPVTSHEVDARIGMPNLDATLEIGPDLAYVVPSGPGHPRTVFGLLYRAREALGSGFSVHQAGYTGGPYGQLVWGRKPWRFSGSLSVLFGDRRSNGYFFDVAPASAISGRPVYSAPAGYAGTEWTVTASRHYARAWAGAFVRVADYQGAAFAASPLLKSSLTVMVGFAVYGYRALPGG